MSNKYHHDHDEELGCYWFNDSPRLTKASLDRPRLRPRDLAYWNETASLVMEYFVLQAGHDDDTLRRGFIAWLKRSPGERRQYEEGDDMARAALVDWFLRVVR